MCLLVLHCWSASAGGIGAGDLACVRAWTLVCRVVCFKIDGCRPESVRRIGDSPRVSLCGWFHDSGLPMIVCMSGLHLVALSLLVDVVHFWLPCTYLLFSCLCFLGCLAHQTRGYMGAYSFSDPSLCQVLSFCPVWLWPWAAGRSLLMTAS